MKGIEMENKAKEKDKLDSSGMPFAVFLLIGYVIYLIKQAFGG